MEQPCGNLVNKGQLAVSLVPASATQKPENFGLLSFFIYHSKRIYDSFSYTPYFFSHGVKCAELFVDLPKTSYICSALR